MMRQAATDPPPTPRDAPARDARPHLFGTIARDARMPQPAAIGPAGPFRYPRNG